MRKNMRKTHILDFDEYIPQKLKQFLRKNVRKNHRKNQFFNFCEYMAQKLKQLFYQK